MFGTVIKCPYCGWESSGSPSFTWERHLFKEHMELEHLNLIEKK